MGGIKMEGIKLEEKRVEDEENNERVKSAVDC